MDGHVVVLAGGLSHERDISLRSGSRIAGALREVGYDVTIRDTDAGLLPWLREQRPDAAVIALHGGRGENGAIQTVLELLDIPFVGTTAARCRLAWDKPSAKVLLAGAGLDTPRWLTLSHRSFKDLGAEELVRAITARIGLPLVVKPHQGGSALGVQVVRESTDLPAALVASFAYDDVVMVEEHIPGTEVAVTVIDDSGDPVALPAVEIEFPGDLFDYEARYTAGLTRYYTPARLPGERGAAVAAAAVSAHRTLGLRDVSRTDAIVAEDGRVMVLEVNVSPGLTETSMLPMAVEASGRRVGEVYAELLTTAIARTGAT